MFLKESYKAAISQLVQEAIPQHLAFAEVFLLYMFLLREQPSLSTLDRKVQAQCSARCEHYVGSSTSACFSSYSAFLGEFTLDETHLKPVQHSNPEAIIHHYSVSLPSHSFTLFAYVLCTPGKSCTLSLLRFKAATSFSSQKSFL